MRYNVVNLETHYAKWKQLDKKGHLIPWFHLYEKSRTGKPTATGRRTGAARGPGKWGSGEQLPNGRRASFWGDENVSGGGGCTVSWRR